MGCNERAPETWEELELPVLRWVHESVWAQPGELERLGDKPSGTISGLTDRQVGKALRRLLVHGLIVGVPDEGAGVVWWRNVRPTADGLRVLGEWPPVEAAAVNVTLARVLRAVAGQLDDEDATAARRAGSALSKMSGDVVLDIVTGRMRALGEDVAS